MVGGVLQLDSHTGGTLICCIFFFSAPFPTCEYDLGIFRLPNVSLLWCYHICSLLV